MTITTKDSTPGGIIAGVIVGVLIACLIIAIVFIFAGRHYPITTYYIPLNFTGYYNRKRCSVVPGQGIHYNYKNYFIYFIDVLTNKVEEINITDAKHEVENINKDTDRPIVSLSV